MNNKTQTVCIIPGMTIASHKNVMEWTHFSHHNIYFLKYDIDVMSHEEINHHLVFSACKMRDLYMLYKLKHCNKNIIILAKFSSLTVCYTCGWQNDNFRCLQWPRVLNMSFSFQCVFANVVTLFILAHFVFHCHSVTFMKSCDMMPYTILTLGTIKCHVHKDQGCHSLNGRTSYRKISRSLEAARFGFRFSYCSQNWQSPRQRYCLSNFRAIRSL